MSESRSERRRRRNRRLDRLAAWCITVGGVAIIASVILILVLIVEVALPLFKRPSADVIGQFAAGSDSRVLAVGVDEYLESVFTLNASGAVVFFDRTTGRELERVPVSPPAETAKTVIAAEPHGNLRYALSWDDGSASVVQVAFTTAFDDAGKRSLRREVNTLATAPPLEDAGVPLHTTARALEGDGTVRADMLEGNRLAVSQTVTTRDVFGHEKSEAASFAIEDTLPGAITQILLDTHGVTLYAGTDNGFLLRWDLSEPGTATLLDRFKAFPDGRAVTALAMVFGDVSLAVGDADGGVTTWASVNAVGEPGRKTLALLHTLTPHDSAVESLVPSLRNKSLLGRDRNGTLQLDNTTGERHLLTLAGTAPLTNVALATRGNGLVGFDERGVATTWALHNPHPEVSLRTLFGKVWYEGYDRPEYVWQSSASTDDFEPKLSLVPLIFGSIKGTLYAMIYAVPLALFGAVYTSQFTTHGFRGFIKPTVEIMAAVPSVVIGFLIALWLAPVIEGFAVPVLLALVLMPAYLMVFVLLWQPLRRFPLIKRIEGGYEFLILAPVLLASAVSAYYLGGPVEARLFDGNFTLWLFQQLGMRYDQRNALIIAFGLGFAVIPIIFTISEDALSSVPHTLTAGSLALGASRWQTVWRVVLPSASPGVFAAMMIGFGRAVGETMIVLMATGNTPLMDWSPFNGMRTLSANIAVEIPEAPLGGTLYRVLFLSAVLLFLLTSVLNTAAELVRQHLRKKYGQHA